MEKDKILNQYDQIIAESVSYVHEIAALDGMIVIDEPSKLSQFEWEMVRIFDGIFRAPIYVHGGLVKRWRIKRRYGLKTRAGYDYQCNLHPAALLLKMSTKFNVDMSIFEDICKEYYTR